MDDNYVDSVIDKYSYQECKECGNTLRRVEKYIGMGYFSNSLILKYYRCLNPQCNRYGLICGIK